MKEDKRNIVAVCSDCSRKIHQTWQEFNTNTEIKKGDFIKVAFTDSNGTEHLWIRITQVIPQSNEQVYIGRISNIPILVSSYKYNQQVKVGRHEIEDLMTKEKEEQK